MKFAISAAAVAIAVVSTPVMAQEKSDLSGFKVGALVGIDSVKISDGTDSGTDEGVMYGVTVGYDYADAAGYVLGLEGEWSDSEVSETATDVFVAGDQARLSAGRDLYIGIRGGVPLGTGLLYAKVGYTSTKVSLSYDDGTGAVSDSDNLKGFRLGAGGEVPMGTNLALRLEYRYSDYGEYSYAGVNTGLSASRNQGVVTLLGKF